MIALGSVAFDPKLAPESLFQSAALVRREHPDEAEVLDDFAHDWATILNLPEQRLS